MRQSPSTRGFELFYGPEYVCAAYEFDTTRKAQCIAESLVSEPIAGGYVGPRLDRATLVTLHRQTIMAADTVV